MEFQKVFLHTVSDMIVAQAGRKHLWHLVDFDSQDVCSMNLTQTLSS